MRFDVFNVYIKLVYKLSNVFGVYIFVYAFIYSIFGNAFLNVPYIMQQPNVRRPSEADYFEVVIYIFSSSSQCVHNAIWDRGMRSEHIGK